MKANLGELDSDWNVKEAENNQMLILNEVKNHKTLHVERTLEVGELYHCER